MIEASELAKLMLKWEVQRIILGELEAVIRDTVLEVGKTQTVGNVRASYSKGRRTFQYQAAAEGHPMVSDATIGLYKETRTITTINWKAICTHAGIEGDELPVTQGAPSVRIKLLT